MRRILVTGGAGFIGSNFVRHLLSQKGFRVRVVDKLTYAGNLNNFPKDLWKNPRFEFVRGDIRKRDVVRPSLRGVDAVVNFAAETFIDRSIVDTNPFVMTDFLGTYILLDEFRRRPCDRFVQISTCEIYGSARKVPMDENHPIMPQSPYSATKAGADRLCYSYFETYGLPIVVLRPFNQYGPNQHPEKVIPFYFTQALLGRPLFVYGSGRNTRDWTYVLDFCEAVQRMLDADENKVIGQVFNVGSGREKNVLQIARAVLRYLGKPEKLVQHIKDRPGHVRRLVCDTKKTRRLLGWQAKTGFDEGLNLTLDWYMKHQQWWKNVMRRKSYRDFYRQWYEKIMASQ